MNKRELEVLGMHHGEIIIRKDWHEDQRKILELMRSVDFVPACRMSNLAEIQQIVYDSFDDGEKVLFT